LEVELAKANEYRPGAKLTEFVVQPVAYLLTKIAGAIGTHELIIILDQAFSRNQSIFCRQDEDREVLRRTSLSLRTLHDAKGPSIIALEGRE
jgi:hypothetical protein